MCRLVEATHLPRGCASWDLAVEREPPTPMAEPESAGVAGPSVAGRQAITEWRGAPSSSFLADTAARNDRQSRFSLRAPYGVRRRVGIRLTYSVTPGSLTLWSVQLLRRIHRSTAPVSTSNAATNPNALASNRRFP